MFPKLTFGGEKEETPDHSSGFDPLLQEDSQTSVVLEGDRASRGKNGMFLVWSTERGFPRLSVYRTRDMYPDQKPVPWRKFDLGLGSSSWEAKFIEVTEIDKNSVAVLISEDFAHIRKRFLVWDVKKDRVNYELCVSKPERRVGVGDWDPFCENERASSSVEGSLPARSSDAYQIRVLKDNWQKIDVSRKHSLVGWYSWQSHACVIASLKSGVAFKEIALPADEHLHPFVTPIQAGFDPRGSHFVVFGDSAIFAFTEPFMCPDCQTASEERAEPACSSIHDGHPDMRLNLTQTPETKHDHIVALLSALPGRALCPSMLIQTESMKSNCSFAKHLNNMDQCHIIDAALLPDGHCLTFLISDGDEGYKLLTLDARNCHKRDARKIEEYLNVRNNNAFEPERVFLHQNSTDSELELVLTSRSPQATVLLLSVTSGASVSFKVPVYFVISQTNNRQRLVLLTCDAVCLLDLRDRTVCQRIQYNVRFDALLQMVHPRDQSYGNQSSHFYQVSRVSDAGDCVLLGWNARTRKPILVNPSSTQDTCEKEIRSSEDQASPFCSLSWNGACTIFIDCDELSNGRITVGVFNHDGDLFLAS